MTFLNKKLGFLLVQDLPLYEFNINLFLLFFII